MRLDFETSAYHAVTVLRIDDQVYFLDVDGAPRRTQVELSIFVFDQRKRGLGPRAPQQLCMCTL